MNEVLQVRFGTDDLMTLRALAKELGVAVSTLVRMVALNYKRSKGLGKQVYHGELCGH